MLPRGSFPNETGSSAESHLDGKTHLSLTHTRTRTSTSAYAELVGSVSHASSRSSRLCPEGRWSHADTEHVFTCLCLDSRCRFIFYLRSHAEFNPAPPPPLSLCLSLCPAIFFFLTSMPSFILELRVIFFFCIIL